MADNEYTPECSDVFKEAVCIDAMRVYDSCSAKDCIEDIRVLFPPAAQNLLNSAVNVRTKDIDVISVKIDMQPIPFNRGYYSVDMTFFFDVCLEVFCAGAAAGEKINGVAVFNKKAILYGSEGRAKMFSCGDSQDAFAQGNCSVPKATVQVAKPVALSVKLCDICSRYGCEPCCVIPESICSRYGGNVESIQTGNAVYVTIGLFTIVQIIRNVQILVPAFDYCIPEKECTASCDNPCELFRKIEFPTEDFFPPRSFDPGCGCNK